MCATEQALPDAARAIRIARSAYRTRKVAVLGCVGVGKTSLILAMSGEDPRASTPKATIGLDYVNVDVSYGEGASTTLEIYDTAGSERFDGSMSMSFVRTVDIIVFVYDMRQQDTLERVAMWKSDVSNTLAGRKKVATILVGNKADVPPTKDLADRGISMMRALELTAFTDASAHTHRNVDDIVHFLATVEIDQRGGAEHHVQCPGPTVSAAYFTSYNPPTPSTTAAGSPARARDPAKPNAGTGFGRQQKRVTAHDIIIVDGDAYQTPGSAHSHCC
jgi:small GTP-binding protein